MPDQKERLSEASSPAAEALRRHALYRGKVQMMPKCPIRSREDFAIWYTPGVAAPATANLGTLYPSADLQTAAIVATRVPAKCDGRGILTIGEGPSVGPYVLPGNNYHVYDYSLFWANVRADADRRLKAFR